MTALLLVALLMQARDATAARPTPAGSAALGGVVTTTSAAGKQPLRRAVLTIAGTGINGARQVVTDDAGKFVVERLSAGRFTLTVEKPGYLRTHYGSRRPGRPPGTPIALIEGQRWLDLSIDVPRGGVIDGTVLDENGSPIASSQVIAQQVAFVAGERRLLSAGGSGPAQSVTDDLGHYRLFGLPPGDYIVRAIGGAMRVPMLAESEFKAVERQLQTGRVEPLPAAPVMVRDASYFPNASGSASAQIVTLGLSEERAGVDIVNAPVPTFTIEFNAVGPAGRPILGASIGMAVVTTRSMYTSPGGVLVDQAGRGRVTGLSAGRYLFFGSGRETDEPGAPTYWASAEVDVNGADAAAMVQFMPGSRVSGRLKPIAGALPALPSGARVQLNPAPLISGTMRGATTAAVNPDGTFAFTNVAPGRYRIELGGVIGWKPSSAMYQNADTLDDPLDVQPGLDVGDLSVTITDQASEISGIVTDRAGRPTPEFSVIVFSADRALWSSPRRNSGIVRIGTDGRYKVPSLPAGSYYLAVVNDIDANQIGDPIFLEQLMTGAVPIRLTDGQKVVQDLKIGG